MSNKYEVNAWVIVEGATESEASQQVHDIIGHAQLAQKVQTLEILTLVLFILFLEKKLDFLQQV